MYVHSRITLKRTAKPEVQFLDVDGRHSLHAYTLELARHIRDRPVVEPPVQTQKTR